MTLAALQPLADRAALFVALRQEALSHATDALGEHRWDVDMTARTLTFTAVDDASRQLQTRAHLIATIAPGPRSLLWAWAHPQGDPASVAAQLQAYGEQYAVNALRTPEVAFPDSIDGDLEEWIATLSHTVGAVAVEIIGHGPYYSAPVGGGTRAVFLLDAPLPPLTVQDAVIAMPRLLASLSLEDARGSVWDLARLAGWNMQWSDESFSAAVVSDASGSATFRFDEQARIIAIESSLSATA